MQRRAQQKVKARSVARPVEDLAQIVQLFGGNLGGVVERGYSGGLHGPAFRAQPGRSPHDPFTPRMGREGSLLIDLGQ
ncbi:hypothetical protein U879_14160 [Defluviimonas sp. 20V17]|nr:hypothetical protein U879_14160 [Defluviimonas sp. 20V17]